MLSSTVIPSDDIYFYVVVRQQLYWQHAADNCLKMGGALARVDAADEITRLLLAMAEDREKCEFPNTKSTDGNFYCYHDITEHRFT
jgi:hypothetical protein